MTEPLRVLFACPHAAPSAAEPLLEACAAAGELEIRACLAEPRAMVDAAECDVAVFELPSGFCRDRVGKMLANIRLPVVVLSPNLDPSEELSLLRMGAQEAVDLERLETKELLHVLRRATARRGNPPFTAAETWEGRSSPVQERERRSNSDVSRREREIRQVQKMEAVGSLAAGIAHDVNNILGSIMGLASVLCDDLAMDDHRRKDAVAITEACKQGRTLVRNLMGFARKGKFQQREVHLGEILAELAESASLQRQRDLAIDLRIAEDLPCAYGDPDQLRLVLRNLVDNALEAMHTGGSLGLEARLVVLDENDVSPYRDVRPGSFLLVEVCDTGVGMDSDTLERVFEPFFTTRPRGEAKGLGLSMAYGAVRHHGGLLQLHSEPGKGTRVSVYLPTRERQAQVSAAPPPARRSMPRLPDPAEIGRGRVALIVDDEELMRISARRMLERFGFEVRTAHQGEAAVEVLAQDPGRFDLVLLDMIMPVLSGAEAFEKLRDLRPDLPILLCSGFARESQTDELLSRGHTGFLLKPFGLDALEKALIALRLP